MKKKTTPSFFLSFPLSHTHTHKHSVCAPSEALPVQALVSHHFRSGLGWCPGNWPAVVPGEGGHGETGHSQHCWRRAGEPPRMGTPAQLTESQPGKEPSWLGSIGHMAGQGRVWLECPASASPQSSGWGEREQRGREQATARESTEMITDKQPRPAVETAVPRALQWSDNRWSWVSPRLGWAQELQVRSRQLPVQAGDLVQEQPFPADAWSDPKALPESPVLRRRSCLSWRDCPKPQGGKNPITKSR